MRRLGLMVLTVVLAAIVLAPASPAAPVPTDRWMLIVGINDYAGGTHDTIGGVGDAQDLAAYAARAGVPTDHVRVLTDRQATAQAIRDGLQWLGDVSSDTSLSVFHFSGHVKQVGGDPDRDGEAVDEMLWGADNRFIADGELAQWIRRIRGHSWTDIAGCEAAGFDDGISAPNRLFTSSSLEHEKSYEHPDWRNSIFTGLMVDQGMLQKQADADGNARVSIQEAFRYAEQRAPQLTAGQSAGPQHPLLAGGDGTSWYLSIPKPPPPKQERTCFLVLRCADS
jgi:hypothetical protein